MTKIPAIIRLTEEERNTLGEWSRDGTPEHASVERARIILLSDEEYSVQEIARRLQTRPARVSKWRRRFAKYRLFGLSDFQRAGKPGIYDEQTPKRVLDLLQQPPPRGYARWNGRLLSESLGDVSQAQVWRILRHHHVQLERRHSWSICTDPAFAPKATDIVGLYLNPPENALVLCIDDASKVPAEFEKGYLRLTNGKAVKHFMSGEGSDGTLTLSEALKVITGQLQEGHCQQRCRRQFLDFMNDVIAVRPGKTIHVVLNHLNVHKPKWDRWLQAHPRVHLHFTPTFVSWLNQAECWFNILAGGTFSTANIPPARQLREAIESFVGAYPEQNTPFEWAKVPHAASAPVRAT